MSDYKKPELWFCQRSNVQSTYLENQVYNFLIIVSQLSYHYRSILSSFVLMLTL